MATLSQLVEAIAEVEGMDSATVALIARTVREAGLITTGGRGPSAGKMTVADAANLLIAVNTSASAREAPDRVRKYRQLEMRSAEESKLLSTFGDAIEQLILACNSRTLPKVFLSMAMPRLLSQKAIKSVDIYFHNKFRADINISVDSWGILGLYSNGSSLTSLTARKANRVVNLSCRFRSPNDDWFPGDQQIVTKISVDTIKRVFSVLEYGPMNRQP